eukprot:6240843-Amphidinium_carterae.1
MRGGNGVPFGCIVSRGAASFSTLGQSKVRAANGYREGYRDNGCVGDTQCTMGYRGLSVRYLG